MVMSRFSLPFLACITSHDMFDGLSVWSALWVLTMQMFSCTTVFRLLHCMLVELCNT